LPEEKTMKKITYLLLIVCVALMSCKNVQEISVSKVEGFKIKDLSSKGIDAEVGLRIKNPNNFSFKIYRSGLNFTINDIDVGEAKLSKKIKIKAGSDQVYYFQLKSDFSKVSLFDIPKVIEMIQNKTVHATLKGDIKAGNLFYKKRFPVNLSEKVNLNKGR
jgi:LEA14-like dessication related protein